MWQRIRQMQSVISWISHLEDETVNICEKRAGGKPLGLIRYTLLLFPYVWFQAHLRPILNSYTKCYPQCGCPHISIDDHPPLQHIKWLKFKTIISTLNIVLVPILQIRYRRLQYLMTDHEAACYWLYWEIRNTVHLTSINFYLLFGTATTLIRWGKKCYMHSFESSKKQEISWQREQESMKNFQITTQY